MHDDIKKEICHEANERFINESLSGYPKFQFLPFWLKNKSNYLEKERLRPTRFKKIYKRGSIVYVDFGINVGNELSGNHFAIVINNRDNERNGVLTVIPISSKKKWNYLELGRIIEISSIKHFASERDKINSKIKNIKNELIELRDADDATLLSWDSEALNKKVGLLEDEVKAYDKVFLAYQKYSKDSFAMPLSIQTVSKDRIREINKHDPSGKIKAPANIMDKIDRAVLANYTKQD